MTTDAASALEAFEASAAAGTLPPGLAPPLLALWHALRGDWDAAHAAIQDDEGPAGCWVHAHLHREEGDLPNARYWYSRAGKVMPVMPVPQERRMILSQLLAAE